MNTTLRTPSIVRTAMTGPCTSASRAHRAHPDGRRAAREFVIAPVTITPTKPLTPTHVKGLLWADVLFKATATLGPTTLVWNPRMSTLTTQTTAFWNHLDRTEPDTDWSGEGQTAIGRRYVEFHSGRPTIDPSALDPYFAQIERDGWIHPASHRLLELWRTELDLLHVRDPGLTDTRPLAWSEQRALAALADRGLLIDHRPHGGPVYLDGARWGVPIRQIVSVDGHANYLLPILRSLLPAVAPGRLFLLLFDEGLAVDYLLLDRILAEFGADTTRLPLSRVPIGGKVVSSKYGGWTGSTLSDLSAISGSADADAYRLGMRLYFVGLLDRQCSQSFRVDLLRRCVGRAARILALGPSDEREDPALPLSPHGYVDPHRLACSLFGPRPAPLPALLREVLV
ncbi:hypothetical protein ACIREM_40950 [Streptomyces shenzhenensis]|uniref:hypothetical protein n=1 Tax=Streptomyces shenzhenensis TaxID=943815 RepID=UPI00381538E6